MIRQVTYCDVCGAQRRETNHWFIAYELSGELRASGWTSQSLHHPGIKHLCGESCLHKLLSEFLASSAQTQTVHTEAFVAQSAAASVDMAFVAEPSVSRNSQTQFTSTSSKASQHAQIAEFIGATRETVTRALTVFKERGLVEIRGCTLKIPSTTALRKYAERV